jgi:hypothetical protein
MSQEYCQILPNRQTSFRYFAKLAGKATRQKPPTKHKYMVFNKMHSKPKRGTEVAIKGSLIHFDWSGVF